MAETKNEVAESKTETIEKKKGGMSPILIGCGIGCLVILVLIGVVFAVAGKMLSSKFGESLVKNAIEKGIESKTGLNIDTGKDGSIVSLTDEKTGGSVNIGGNKLPEGFPSDFPLYKNAKVTASASEGTSPSTRGYWVTMSTTDALSGVMKFYETSLTANGWKSENTVTTSEGGSWDISKGSLQGTVMVTRGTTDKETGIVINVAPRDTAPAGE